MNRIEYINLITSYVRWTDTDPCEIRSGEYLKELYSIMTAFVQHIADAHTSPFIPASLHALYRMVPDLLQMGFGIGVLRTYIHACNLREVRTPQCHYVTDGPQLCHYPSTQYHHCCVKHNAIAQLVRDTLAPVVLSPLIHIIDAYLHI